MSSFEQDQRALVRQRIKKYYRSPEKLVSEAQALKQIKAMGNAAEKETKRFTRLSKKDKS